jgi:AraC-like DNA-binding protein
MVASPTPPQHVLFETTDHDQAGEHLIRIYGTRPMGYLRRVRLDRAYQDLPAADRTSADSVAEIARRWGLATRARFCALYRRAYGRPPHGDLIHNLR